MKRINSINLIFLLFLIHAHTFAQRNTSNIHIQSFKMDSVSIRAIHPIDTKHVYYAGSNGSVGLFSAEENTTTLTVSIKYLDSLTPNFRSIASSNNGIYALSVGNPALLYKVSKNNYDLKYIEKNEKVFYDSMYFFDDKLHGIAVGDPTEDCPSIILTDNGGETWHKLPCSKLPLFEDGEAFFAASNTNIKTIGSSVWIASGGKKARILKSDNYGQTWDIYTTQIIQGDGPQGIYSIDFYDKENGIAIGGNYAKPLNNTANKAITIDGGKTWTLVANQQNPNYKSCVQYVPNSNGKEIVAVGKTGISYSKDGGYSWQEISKEPFYAIKFVDKNNAWLSGNNKLGTLVFK